ncbi:DUF4352 domain-containing protein [Oceanobacillus limi]|nr:DUF4352 domain-containing protein [Oceanobacillus limi]
MKKLMMVFVAVILAGVLVACSEDDNGAEETNTADNTGNEVEENNDGEADQDTDSEAEAEEENDTEGSAEAGDVLEDEVGKLSIVKKNADMEEVFTSGPMEITITGVQTAELEPSESYGDFFDNKEKVTIVTVGMKAENTSEDTISIYPDQSTLTTNAGDQVEADLWLSDSIGGEFFGTTNKEGEVIFQLDTPAEEIESIKVIMDGAHDDNYESVGEELQIELEV